MSTVNCRLAVSGLPGRRRRARGANHRWVAAAGRPRGDRCAQQRSQQAHGLGLLGCAQRDQFRLRKLYLFCHPFLWLDVARPGAGRSPTMVGMGA